MRLAINQEFLSSLEGIGIDYEKIVRRANLPRLLWEDTPKLNTDEYFTLLTVLGESMKDEQLLKFSDIRMLNMFVPPLFAAMCAVNGAQAIERLAKYKSLIGPVDLKVKVTETRTKITFLFDNSNVKVPNFCLFNEQLLLISLLRNGTGRPIIPNEIKSSESYSATITNYLGCKPTCSVENEIVFSNHDLSHPFLTKNNIMWKYLEPEFLRELEANKQQRTFSEIVEEYLHQAVPSGNFSLQNISDLLGKSPRSIQRLLIDEKTSFRTLVRNTQIKLAHDYLSRTNLSVEELGYLLGYEEVSSFRRAFKQWTGKTVTDYRKGL